MAVRKIPRSYRNLTGRVAIAKQENSAAFESPLERDLYVLLDFNPAVASIQHQPFRIDYMRADERFTHYTPDALIFYRPEYKRKPVLCEVKPYEQLRKDWSDLRPGFKAAVSMCRREGWIFHIYTENQIRTPYLQNARFLRAYRDVAPDELRAERVRGYLRKSKEATLGSLLTHFCPQESARGAWLSLVWHLIATGRLQADLQSPLGYSSPLTIASTEQGP